MKIAVLSDIHGNSFALKQLYSSLSKFDLIIVCGDLVGYYYNAAEVLSLLESMHAKVIRGNHEQMLLDVIDGKIDLEHVTQKYGHGISRAKELSHAQLDYLRQLPEKINITLEGKNICICHGSPFSADEYVYPDSISAHTQIATLNDDIFIMGHTHYPMKILLHGKLLINPGSVGQPRDRDCRSSWGELNLKDMDFTINRTAYDQTELLKQIELYDPQLPFLREVLLR